MSAVLKELGFTQAELQDKVIERLCDRLLNATNYDEDGDTWIGDSTFHTELNDRIQKAVDAKFDALAAEHVEPKLDERIQNLILQRTNEWGEKKGEPITLTEYLIQRAEHYMLEEVNHDGKAKRQDAYNWRRAGTRIEYAIDRYLQYHIQTAMETILKDANNVLTEGIKRGVEIKLDELKKRLKVSATVK